MRYKFLHFLRDKIWHVPEGLVAPKPLLVLYYILFPIHAFWTLNPWFSYDIMTGVFTYRGIKYSLRALDHFSSVPPNVWFRVEREKNGEMIVHTMRTEKEDNL